MGDPDDDAVLCRREGAVAVVTLNRPRVRNAINAAMARALDRLIAEIEEDDSIRAWVLCGQENDSHVFCAGADLREVAAGGAAGLMTERGLAGLTHRVRVKPVVVAVDGLATAGGCELVLACDLVVASTRAIFGLAEVRRNLLASAGGVYRLPRALGRRVGLEAILTGEPVPAERAYQLGLVNRLTPPGQALDEALVLSRQISTGAPMASRAALAIVRQVDDLDEEELDRRARQASAVLRDSADTAEAIQAFFDKRPPRWSGR